MTFAQSVRLMRMVCPLALLASIVLGCWAWTVGNYGLVAIDAFLAGVNTMLTWINWQWFRIGRV